MSKFHNPNMAPNGRFRVIIGGRPFWLGKDHQIAVRLTQALDLAWDNEQSKGADGKKCWSNQSIHNAFQMVGLPSPVGGDSEPMVPVSIPHRDRHKALNLCLEALAGASWQISSDDLEVFVVDSSATLPELWHNQFNVIHQEPTPLFNRSKHLNVGVQQCKNEYLTVLDCDTLVDSDFFTKINRFFNQPEHRDHHLSHRFRLVDQFTSQQCQQFGPPADIQQRIDTDWDARGIGFLHFLMGKNDRWAYPAEEYNGVTIGNSHLTMRLDSVKALGGWDERYDGYGLEDYDFNLRAIKKHPVHILTDNDCHHLWHRRAQGQNPQAEQRNRQLFMEIERQGFPPIQKEWPTASPNGEGWISPQ